MRLETKRLVLRQWQATDLPAFAVLNADPEVMRYFPKPLSRAESDAMAHKCQALIAAKGWGFWAAALKSTGHFIGLVGLHQPQADLPFAPCIEVGWRLQQQYWGHGYATEAASAALAFAFETLTEDAVVAFTTVENKRSRAVMTRLGFTDTQQNFMHPDLPEDHVLAEHVLYKLTKADWQQRQ